MVEADPPRGQIDAHGPGAYVRDARPGEQGLVRVPHGRPATGRQFVQPDAFDEVGARVGERHAVVRREAQRRREPGVTASEDDDPLPGGMGVLRGHALQTTQPAGL
nr:hypothetical protein GCM10020093_085990 [Planobispora longispora]